MQADKEFYDKLRQKIEEEFAPKNEAEANPAFSKEEPEQSQIDTEQLPDIQQIMQDINSGKLRYDEVDWELQLKTLLFLCRLMPKKFSNVILVWGILSSLDDPTVKMNITDELQAVAPKCFDDLFAANDFINDCKCISQVCKKAGEFTLRQDIHTVHIWTDERKELNDLAHIFCDEMVDARWMVGMIEEMKRTENDNRKHPMIEIVLRANRNIGRLSIDNIVDFSKGLYIAEAFRQLIISGEEDYRDIPTLEKFNWRLRNACFDVYIDLRKGQIKELLNQDNTRVDEADDFEALKYMLDEEESVVERENGLEAFKGSPAYNAMWYPGRKLILDMINVFIQYLPKKIEKLRKAEETKQGVAPIYANTVNIKDNHGPINNFE